MTRRCSVERDLNFSESIFKSFAGFVSFSGFRHAKLSSKKNLSSRSPRILYRTLKNFAVTSVPGQLGEQFKKIAINFRREKTSPRGRFSLLRIPSAFLAALSTHELARACSLFCFLHSRIPASVKGFPRAGIETNRHVEIRFEILRRDDVYRRLVA